MKLFQQQEEMEAKIVDYLDGKLSEKDVSAVEGYLRRHPVDAERLELNRAAQSLTAAAREPEDFRVSDNFWPGLRDRLGPAPRRSQWSRICGMATGVFGQSGLTRVSLGASFVAIVLVLSAFLFSPQSATHQASAMSAADRAFVTSSIDRHQAYVAAQPVVPGDASAANPGEIDDDDSAH